MEQNAKKQNTSTPKQVLEMAKKAGAKRVDAKFVDTFGTWQHFTLPFHELNEDSFSDGLGFDGSSIRGWKSIGAGQFERGAGPVGERPCVPVEGRRVHGGLPGDVDQR